MKRFSQWFLLLTFFSNFAHCIEINFPSETETDHPAPIRALPVDLSVGLRVSDAKESSKTLKWITFKVEKLDWGSTVDRRNLTENSLYVGVWFIAGKQSFQLYFAGSNEKNAQSAADAFVARIANLTKPTKIILRTPEAAAAGNHFFATDIESFDKQ